MPIGPSLKIHLTSCIEHAVKNRVITATEELGLEGVDLARREGPTSFIVKTKDFDELSWRFFRVKITEIS